MKYDQKRVSNKELLDTFPEAKAIIPQKITEWEDFLNERKGELKKIFIQINDQQADEFSIWFAKQIASLYLVSPILEAKRHILRLSRLLSISNSGGEGLARWQEKVEIARQHPIAEIARENMELRESGNKLVSVCPFHNEKHPSFYIYTETNTFYCFGCQEYGDVIKLTMHLYGVDFKNAVRTLQN